mgnify:CR=1 FL=1
MKKQRYSILPFLTAIFAAFTLGVFITALISIKKTDTVKGADWHGKLTTVSLYLMMGIHLFWFNIPLSVSLIMVGTCVGIMLMSFIMYSLRNIRAIKNKSFDA